MDAVDEKIAAFGRVEVREGRQPGEKMRIIEELEDSFGDERVVAFFLRLISDEGEYDQARVEVLKFLELDPPCSPRARQAIAERIATALAEEKDWLVRCWLGVGIGGYADLPVAFEAAKGRVLDEGEGDDVRFNCLEALERLGPREDVVAVYRVLAEREGSALAAAARRMLSEWGVG